MTEMLKNSKFCSFIKHQKIVNLTRYFKKTYYNVLTIPSTLNKFTLSSLSIVMSGETLDWLAFLNEIRNPTTYNEITRTGDMDLLDIQNKSK